MTAEERRQSESNDRRVHWKRWGPYLMSVIEGAAEYGPFDVIFEATGFSPIVFEAMQALGKNGALVLSSVTGGDRHVDVPSDMINLKFVLGNKVVVGTLNTLTSAKDAIKVHCEVAGVPR